MNNSTDSCGQRDDRTDNNILPEVGGGMSRDSRAERGQEAAEPSCGKTRVELNVGGVRGENSEAGELAGNSAATPGSAGGSVMGAGRWAGDLARIPEGVRASAASRPGEYDARRLRSQREIIRDVMISAADCETWLTLGELRALTRYGEASISAQLRHLRKTENGGYDVAKRHREGATPDGPRTDGRGECVWEYRITRGVCGLGTGGTNSGRATVVA